jgi:hypothetical protein
MERSWVTYSNLCLSTSGAGTEHKGEETVKPRIVSRVTLVVGLILISAVVAHAGSGGGGVASALKTPFECYAVFRGPAPQNPTVDISDSEFGTDQTAATLGNVAFVCTPVEVSQGGSPLGVPDNAAHLTCYSIPQTDTVVPATNAVVNDPLLPIDQALTVSKSRYLCLPALTGDCDLGCGP